MRVLGSSGSLSSGAPLHWRQWGNKSSGYWLIVDTVTSGGVVMLAALSETVATERRFIGVPFRAGRYRDSRTADRSGVLPRVFEFGMKASHAVDDATIAAQFRAARIGEPLDLLTLPRYGATVESDEERADRLTRILAILKGTESPSG